MIEATPSGAFASEHPGQPIDAPFVSFDVPFELARLRTEHAYDVDGHTGRTLAKNPDLRVVLEAMKEGVRLAFHETAERMILQVIVGQLRIWTEYGENCDLAEGSFAAVDAGRVHEIECLRECAFLLTLAWPPGGRRAGPIDEDAAGLDSADDLS
jgi:quercetin dioxygenase-like cupin family protein